MTPKDSPSPFVCFAPCTSRSSSEKKIGQRGILILPFGTVGSIEFLILNLTRNKIHHTNPQTTGPATLKGHW